MLDKNTVEYERWQVIKEVLFRYLEIYDIDNGTIHTKVFTMLYLSPTHNTYKQICEQLFISKNTLIRYKDKYEKLAAKICEKLDL